MNTESERKDFDAQFRHTWIARDPLAESGAWEGWLAAKAEAAHSTPAGEPEPACLPVVTRDSAVTALHHVSRHNGPGRFNEAIAMLAVPAQAVPAPVAVSEGLSRGDALNLLVEHTPYGTEDADRTSCAVSAIIAAYALGRGSDGAVQADRFTPEKIAAARKLQEAIHEYADAHALEAIAATKAITPTAGGEG